MQIKSDTVCIQCNRGIMERLLSQGLKLLCPSEFPLSAEERIIENNLRVKSFNVDNDEFANCCLL